MKASLTTEDFKDAADLLQCDPDAIQAVCLVEAPRGGFNPDSSPVTLFEGHKFHAFTRGIYDKDYPSISYPHWDKSKYGHNWQAEQKRLQQAIALDRNAALKSASWGKFQIMGFNFEYCSFDSLQAFINAMYRSERDHLMAFVRFLESSHLTRFLREMDWAEFARGYNGAGFARNEYDIKLKAAYDKLKGEA